MDRCILAFSRDPDFTELYTAALDAAGLPSLTARVAGALPDLLVEQAPAAALVDVLGERDWEVIAVCHGRGIPTIVVTGWWSPDRLYRDRAFAAGAAAFVMKPVSATDLVAVVRKVLDGERQIDLLPPSR